MDTIDTTKTFIPEHWSEHVATLAARHRGQEAFRLKTTARRGDALVDREEYAIGTADLLTKIEDALRGATSLAVHVTPVG